MNNTSINGKGIMEQEIARRFTEDVKEIRTKIIVHYKARRGEECLAQNHFKRTIIYCGHCFTSELIHRY